MSTRMVHAHEILVDPALLYGLFAPSPVCTRGNRSQFIICTPDQAFSPFTIGDKQKQGGYF
jgi:hypothetical protein